jgi:molybdopterin synthase sulfur carrier subunit
MSAPVRLLYFAWLRARIGVTAEEVALPAEVGDVAALLDWLRERGPRYAEALRDLSVVRVAVNQDYVGPDHPVRAGDEVALFPPVTGG